MNSPGNQSSAPPEFSRGKLVFSWLLIIGLLTLVFANWERRQENPNTRPVARLNASGQQEVVLQRNRYGHYVTRGLINGHEVTLLLDTGATTVAIPEKIARQLNLKRMARGTASTANGLAEIFYTRIDSLSIGALEIHDISASINPGMNHDETVLLGMSALRNVEFSQRGDQLTLRTY